MNSKSIVYSKAYDLALDIVRLYGEYNESKLKGIFHQLLKSGTSIGANLAEANAAFRIISKKDKD
ncbi:MAG: four helix bundle protein [Bacteroidales bacterium]|nr:four helix bundle protein [Bacteroidales bacterium]